MTEICVALIDDHQLVRDGLRSLLSSMPGIAVVAEADNGRDAVAIARRADIDVIVMDIAMSGLNGLEATKRIITANASKKIIILSMHASEEYVIRALQFGALGYVIKNSDPGELENAVRKVAAGEIFISPTFGDKIHVDVLKQTGATETSDTLTSRQREILQAIAEGTSTRNIAEQLSISPKTVETHRSQIMQKLSIDNVAGLVRYAIRHGMIEVD